MVAFFNKRIGVFTGANLPSKYAHSFNVMKMAQGFISLGVSAEVISANSLATYVNRLRIKDISNHYGISNKIRLKWLFPSLRTFFSGETAGDKVFCQKAAKYAYQNGFDFIYCRSYLVPYYAVNAGIPTFVETHTTNYDHPDLQKIYEVSRLSAFKCLVTIHESIKEEYIKRGVPSEKTLVLEDGVDLQLFNLDDDKRSLKRELGLNINKLHAVYCGHLYEDKGIEIILRAAKKLEGRKNLNFLLVGGFEEDKKHWIEYCNDNNINNVQFTGFISNSLVPKYLKAADCLLLPYKTNMKYVVMDIHTTSPLKLFEYMASKRPIIATDVPTVRKIIKNGVNGILAKIENVEDFCHKIEQVLDSPDCSQILAEQAFMDVKKYTWQNRCKRILSKFD